MPSTPIDFAKRARRLAGRPATAALVLLLLVTAFSWWFVQRRGAEPMLLAPMVGAVDLCLIEPADAAAEHDAQSRQDCRAPGGSAAARIETALAELGPKVSPSGRYELGYTLNIPLLQLYRRDGALWRINDEFVARFVRTVRDTDRPVIVYLFATHFSVNAPIERELAADAKNLAVLPSGPMAVDRYHGLDVFPWSVAATSNDITLRRVEAIRTIARQLCELPWWHRRRIRAVTLLGEVHHLYPDFESGMGYGRPYQVSDYSDASKSGFRDFLRARFLTVEAVNAALGSSFPDFDAIDPPSKDIRNERLRHFWEHIDASAHGILPVNGWAHAAGQPTPTWIHVYLNGRKVARVAADLSRQDVAAARPEFGTADVGWRVDLGFADLPHGLHRIDVLAETADGALHHLGSRRVAYVDRTQSPVQPAPATPLPPHHPAGGRIAFSIDTPTDLGSVFFNPLVPLWHEFRGQQVAGYLQHVGAQLQGTCLADVPAHVHQIAPFANPSWDATKQAVDASLRPLVGLKLGISLYGEATYGRSFFDWHDRRPGERDYGITEFHPLRAMDADELDRTFERHRAHGANFASFFIDGYPRRAVTQMNSVFVYTTFSPDVPAFGSDRLFAAVQQLLRR
jgi:hypothetical protein